MLQDQGYSESDNLPADQGQIQSIEPDIPLHPNMLGDVTEFMAAFGQLPVVDQPHHPDGHIKDLRKRLCTEEVQELVTAIDAGDLEGVADALADSMYVILGTAVAFGIPLHDVWREVHRSNMSKLWSPDDLRHLVASLELGQEYHHRLITLPSKSVCYTNLIADYTLLGSKFRSGATVMISVVQCSTRFSVKIDHKVVKPPSFTPPNLKSLLGLSHTPYQDAKDFAHSQSMRSLPNSGTPNAQAQDPTDLEIPPGATF